MIDVALASHQIRPRPSLGIWQGAVKPILGNRGGSAFQGCESAMPAHSLERMAGSWAAASNDAVLRIRKNSAGGWPSDDGCPQSHCVSTGWRPPGPVPILPAATPPPPPGKARPRLQMPPARSRRGNRRERESARPVGGGPEREASGPRQESNSRTLVVSKGCWQDKAAAKGAFSRPRRINVVLFSPTRKNRSTEGLSRL